MDFKAFEQLTRDSVSFLIGMDVLLQNGRGAISGTERDRLLRGAEKSFSNLMTADVRERIVDMAMELSALSTGDLMDYISRSGFTVRRPDTQEPHVCPLCGDDVSYDWDTARKCYKDKWRCDGCGASGKAHYERVFRRHEEIVDGKGNPVPGDDG